MLTDLRYAFRNLWSQPVVTVVAIVSLALGLAAAAAVVSLLDASGQRPLPVADPGALVQIRALERNGRAGRMSYPDYEDLRARAPVFVDLVAYTTKGAGLSGPEGPPEIVMVNVVSPNYFNALGVTARIGRTFTSEDDAPAAAPAVVISNRVWQRRFNHDSAILQRTIALNGAASNVMGVAPSTFTGLDVGIAPDAWISIGKSAALGGGARMATLRDSREFNVVGRLRTGPPAFDRLRAMFGVVSPVIAQAQNEVEIVMRDLAAAYPATNHDVRAAVLSESDARSGGFKTLGLILWAIVVLVLLIGCGNVAGLLLGRAEDRRREMAVRVSLGAAPRRLVRQLLTESLLLALAAGAAGLLISIWIIRALPALLPPSSIPLALTFQFDLRVMSVTMAVAAATVIPFGLWPAVSGSRAAVAEAARADSTTSRGRRASVRNVLVVAQVAVSFVLLMSGALLVRSARNSAAIDPGFDVRPLLLVTLSPAAVGYDGEHSQRLFRDLAESLAAAPGIERVSMARRIPLDPSGGGAALDVTLPDRAPDPAGPLRVRFNSVLPNYFEVMGTRVVQGRAFADADGPDSPKLAVINETMARQYWPGTPAPGRRVRVTGAYAGDYEIAGVVRDGKINQLGEKPAPYVFLSLLQAPSAERTLILQAVGSDPGRAAPIVRDALRRLDPRMPTMQMITLEQHMRFALYAADLSAMLVGTLSACGLVLSAIGLFGVVSFLVAKRTKEIGVRMALGARPADIMREVLGRAMRLTFWGIGIGLVLALLVGQGMRSSLYGVSPTDPLTFLAIAIGTTLVALLASWVPARRALRIDPIQALRTE